MSSVPSPDRNGEVPSATGVGQTDLDRLPPPPVPSPGRWQRRVFHWPWAALVTVPAVLAVGWAFLIAVFAIAGRLFGPQDERGSWGEVLGAIIGNFALAFTLTLVFTLALWALTRQRSGKGAE